jgi:hypothetical protein
VFKDILQVAVLGSGERSSFVEVAPEVPKVVIFVTMRICDIDRNAVDGNIGPHAD